MSRRPLVPLLALAALLALLPACQALKCYQCSDIAEQDAEPCTELDTSNDKFYYECSDQETKCSKVVQNNGVIRGCTGKSVADGCSKFDFGQLSGTECICSTDYCNSAGLSTPALLLLLPAALLAALYTRQ
ncbi:ly-6/neurotoxin-like protein 1 [Amphibalanus amphitrite]|uniref:ly-6/neurotoxin-like protein 1 n=1 Tax=Amphibalanus amphitrite TaxID=1232801 RepID=UPI001C90E702|nr:ly-6/neurotoxin-like protein 1 [Amphibalanus amphitrite]